jgi:hypothetical protein
MNHGGPEKKSLHNMLHPMPQNALKSLCFHAFQVVSAGFGAYCLPQGLSSVDTRLSQNQVGTFAL